MIICTACGTRNPDNTRFCGVCGAFLEWAGTPIEPGPPAEAAPPSPPPPSPPPPSPPPTAQPVTAQPVTAQPVTAQPAAVQPDRRQTRRAPTAVPEERASNTADGDLTCPRCHTGNDRARRFCRICGAPLAEAATTVRRSWWRRLWDRLTKRGRRPKRPDQSGAAARRLLRITLLICVLVILLIAGPLLAKAAIDKLRDRTQAHVPLVPASVSASSARAGAPASRIADGATNRYWAPTGAAAGSWVEARFASPVRVLDIIVTPGVGTEQSAFLKVGRPHEMEVIATSRTGEVTRTTIQLSDQAGPQRFGFEAVDVLRVRLVVRSVYGTSTKPTVAVGEVEFFGRT